MFTNTNKDDDAMEIEATATLQKVSSASTENPNKMEEEIEDATAKSTSASENDVSDDSSPSLSEEEILNMSEEDIWIFCKRTSYLTDHMQYLPVAWLEKATALVKKKSNDYCEHIDEFYIKNHPGLEYSIIKNTLTALINVYAYHANHQMLEDKSKPLPQRNQILSTWLNTFTELTAVWKKIQDTIKTHTIKSVNKSSYYANQPLRLNNNVKKIIGSLLLNNTIQIPHAPTMWDYEEKTKNQKQLTSSAPANGYIRLREKFTPIFLAEPKITKRHSEDLNKDDEENNKIDPSSNSSTKKQKKL